MVTLEKRAISRLRWNVIIPMVLQISETIVLQRVELEEKTGSSHFWVFEALAVLMGKHGFAEKLHLKLKS